MANRLATCLAQLVQKYHEQQKAGGTDCRLVIPGLTATLSEELHEDLRGRGLQSYLVVPDTSQPDSPSHRMHADGLTSFRLGSMIAVVHPGELTRIQDSIIGSGGAVRSIAFSDEWPWESESSEVFSLRNLIAEYTRSLGADEDESGWIAECIEALVDATRGTLDRGRVVLDEVLGSFDGSLYPSLPTLIEKFAFHAGLVRPPVEELRPTAGASATLARIAQLGAEALDSLARANCRQDCVDRITSKYAADADAGRRLTALTHVLLDAQSGRNTQSIPLLALRGCWQDTEMWTQLDELRIREIFGLAREERLNLEAVLINESALISDGGTQAAIPNDEPTTLRIAVPDLPLDGAGLEVVVTCNRITLERIAVRSSTPIDVPLDWDRLFARGALRSRLNARLLRDGVEKANIVFTLFTVRDSAPLALVLTPGFHVFHAPTADEAVPALETESSLSVSLLSLDQGPEVSLSFNDIEQPLQRADSGLVHCCTNPVEAFGAAGGEVQVVAQRGGVAASVIIRSLSSEAGESSLERELLVRLSLGQASKVKSLLKIYSGSTTDYYTSLSMPESARRRWRIASHWEQSESAGDPVLADLLSLPQSHVLETKGHIALEAGLEAPALVAARPTAEQAELLADYQRAREQLLALLRDNRRHDSRWPDYALWPVYFESHRVDLDLRLRQYLEAYTNILGFVSENIQSMPWEQVFCLLARDSVCHWSNDFLRGRLALMGPWHPLVLAKRFLVQGALVGSAKKFVGLKSEYAFHRLAVLLDNVDSFRWVPWLDRDATRVVHGYASASSDPGWHLIAEETVLGSASVPEIVRQVHRCWGVEATLVPVARDQLAGGFIKDYFNANPHRRAISIAVPATYSAGRIVESCATALEQDGKRTLLGQQLPGGVHVFVDQHADADYDVPPVTPAVRTYRESQAQAVTPNISLLPPPVLEHPKQVSDAVFQARGHAGAAVLAMPSRQVNVGAGAPTSTLIEVDQLEEGEALDVGSAFRKAIALGQGILGATRALYWSFNLPHSVGRGWHVLPGEQIDPAALVAYVLDGARLGEERTLWDYSMSLTGRGSSYFVLTRIPESIKAALNGSRVLGGKDLANDLLTDLAKLGIALGGESLRSSTHALGVLGVIAAIRLFTSPGKTSVLTNLANERGFMLPADSFKDILGPGLEIATQGSNKRTDLVAIQLRFDEQTRSTVLSFASVECKYSSGKFRAEDVPAAHAQAKQAFQRLHALLKSAATPDGIAERLALAHLVGFGLRISAGQAEGALALDARLISCILSGRLRFEEPKARSVVVTTSCQDGEAELRSDENGWWVSLATGSWPNGESSTSLARVMDILRTLFSGAEGEQYDARKDKAFKPDIPVEADPSSKVGLEVVQSSSRAPAPSRTGPLRALLGLVQGAPVFFDPSKDRPRLDNFNFMITGSSGKGKTQLIKGVVKQLREQGLNVFLLDFKNDFAGDQTFLTCSSLRARYVAFDGLPYNPLIPTPLVHPASGEKLLQCSQHISGLVSILGKTFGLGVQQQNHLKEAIRESYKQYGIDPAVARPYKSGIEFPDFNDVGSRLQALSPTAYNRLDPLFDLGIFSTAARLLSFNALLEKPMVLDLSQIQSDPIKNSIARILILSAHSFYNSQSHSPLRQFLVFDEAHRMLDSEDLIKFVRECRAYGVGVVLSSQYPSDFPPEVSASLNTKVIHGNDRDQDRVRGILRLLGPSITEDQAGRLSMFEAFVTNAQHPPTYMRTFAYPQQLVHSALTEASNGMDREELRTIEGLTPQMATYIAEQLKLMGLAEEVNGRWFAKAMPN